MTGKSELDILLSSLPKLEAVDLSYSGLSVVTGKDAHNVLPSNFYELRLAACDLTVFPDFLRAMKNLQILDLSGNYMSGHIPTWAGEIGGNNLTHLDLSDNSITGLSGFGWDGLQYLNLQSNQIQGTFSSAICNMKRLKYLDVSNNRMVEMVPPQCLQNISSSLVSLDVKSNKIQGPFPMTICNMKHLEYLDVSNNRIAGMVPPQCLQNISSSLVSLDVNSNKIQGPFPMSICNMKRLEFLDVSNNNITGMVPPQCLQNISSSLVYLNTKYNVIQGPFPTTICNMSSLLYLDMSHNSFHGMIPQCFGNITSSLALINLRENHFIGTVPKVFGSCELLDGLILNGNKLEGEVPSSLAKCKSLKLLDLGDNQLNGTFPRWLGDLPKLQVLILGSNNLHGTIEASFTSELLFPSLKVFDISNNGFLGRLPEKYFETFNAIKDEDKSPKREIVYINGLHSYSINVPVEKYIKFLYPTSIFVQFTAVDLSSNTFEGEIPNVIGNLKSLVVLNLSNNNLNGQIPDALGNIFPMELLDLSRNQLVGEIPQSLKNLNFLSSLNLSQNHLVGRIPKGIQLLSFEENSYYGNPGLCGPPLAGPCEDVVEAEGGECVNYMVPVMLGLGFGTLLGVGLGYLMLSTGRPKWFNAIADVGNLKNKKKKHVHMRK